MTGIGWNWKSNMMKHRQFTKIRFMNINVKDDYAWYLIELEKICALVETDDNNSS